ncbi:MAG: alpha/beta hydrolase [Deltaproteobacteria bacterium]|jgi:uncharacterized protein|nr:alpha/beta hydrolase [Deltaproteobacteria bacterium]
MSFDGALIFYPSLYPEGNWETQGRGSCAAEDVFFEAEDGVTTHGWFLKNESSDKVLVYYHGNAGSIADRFEWGCQLTQAGVSVLMVEYRGYGKSSGKPSEKGFYRDIEAVWQWLTGAAGFSSHDIVLYGKSLGGAVATELALRHEPGALVLQSTFTSIPDMAQKLIPGVPKFLVPTKMDSLKKLPSIRCPVMVVHSQQDEIVPFSMGQSLARSATNLHAFAHYTGYGHNDLVMGKGEDIVSHIKALVGSFSR